MATATPAGFALRQYQVEAHDATLDALREADSTLLVMPVGTGKTATFSAVAASFRDMTGKPALVVAHRRELIDQAARALNRAGLMVAVEMAHDRASLHGSLVMSADAVAGSVQSLVPRIAHYSPDAFSLLIFDEAHHALPGSGYAAIRQHFAGAKLLGVTATADALRRKGNGALFASVAFEYEIREAMAAGYLVPLRQKRVEVESLDFSKCRTRAGDLSESDLDAMMRDDAVLHGVAGPAVELTEGRPTLVFTVNVAHAHALAAVLEWYGGVGCAVALDGTTDPEFRADTLKRFAAGEFRFLVNCGLFVEGTDLPHASAAVMARPTQSRTLFVQMLGRILRTHPDKADALCLDFDGNSGRHSLMSAPMALGSDVTPEIAKRAAAIAEKTGATVQEALGIVAKRDRLAELRRRATQARANVRVTDIDPFAVLGFERHDGRTSLKPTDKQRETLLRFGLKDADVIHLDRRAASDLLDGLIGSARSGLATFKQKRFLMSRGLRADLSFQEASAVMDAISSNRWQVPDDVFTKYAITNG